MKYERSESKPSRILVVEDEALIAIDLEARLERLGYAVVGVGSEYDEAVELAFQTEPQLILMDINLHGSRSGIEAAKTITQSLDVPVVFLTAYSNSETVAKAIEVSPYGYLLKPVDDRMLDIMVALTLRRHRHDKWSRLFEAAVDNAPTGVAVVEASTSERTIAYANKSFSSLCGIPVDTLIGHTPDFLAVDPADPEVVRLRTAMQNKTEAAAITHCQRAEGERFISSVNISPVPNRAGQLNHLLLLHADVTAEREAQDAAAANQRLEVVGRLAAGVAHDFNNLLSAVLCSAELASESEDLEEIREDLQTIIDSSNHGALLTRKLLSFAKPIGKRTDARVDVVNAVDAMRKLGRQMLGHGISLDIRCPPGPFFVALDEVSMEQILLNLIGNARDAMPAGGKVSVHVNHEIGAGGQELVRIVISDTGRGMPPDVAARIFEPFFTTKDNRGTGLGLWMSRTLLERAAGSIHVDSAPEEGASFTILLPTHHSRAPIDQNPASSWRQHVVGGQTCLIVDDENALRRAYARALRDVGLNVVEAPSVPEGLAALERLGDALDVLVTDLDISGRSGTELIRQARIGNPQAKLIAMTGYIDESIKVDADIPTLWKPVPLGRLIQAVADSLKEGREGGAERPDRVPQPPGAANEEHTSPSAVVPHATAPLRLLLVGSTDATAATVSEALAEEEATLQQCHMPDEMSHLLERGALDLVIIDAASGETEALELARSARAVEPEMGLALLVQSATLETFRDALQAGVETVLESPYSVERVRPQLTTAIAEARRRRLHRSWRTQRLGEAGLNLRMEALKERFESSVDQLYVLYQPLVRTYDDDVYAYEALMRSHGELATPQMLLAAASVLGAVDRLGKAVRTKIASDLSHGITGSEPIFVNIHPSELRKNTELTNKDPLNVHASRVVLEVTERGQLSSTEDISSIINVLRQKGYRIAIDDLGAGHAGLSWLVRLTPDLAKLDMHLIRDIHESRLKRELVASIVGVCHRARIQVVAEGIETAAEAEVVKRLGCDLMQGAFYGQPRSF